MIAFIYSTYKKKGKRRRKRSEEELNTVENLFPCKNELSLVAMMLQNKGKGNDEV